MRRWAGALPLAVALLAGCTDGADDPTVLPSASPTVSPSPSPTPSPPPSAASPQGAAAFARYWYDVLNKATATGDTKLLRQLSSPDCRSCRNIIDSIEDVYPEGRMRGGQYTIRFAEAPALPEKDVAQVSIIYDVTRVDVLDPSGAVVQSGPAERGTELEMHLVRRGSGWAVSKILFIRANP